MSKYQSHYKTYEQMIGSPSPKQPVPSSDMMSSQPSSEEVQNVPSVVIEVKSPEHFKQLLSQKQIVVLDSYADWCRPCKLVAPHFANLAINYYNKYPNVGFAKVNVDMRSIHDICNVSAVPTFFIYLNGQMVEEINGANINEISMKIDNVLKSISKRENYSSQPQYPQQYQPQHPQPYNSPPY